MMRNQGQLFPLFRGQVCGMGKVADIDQIGFQKLAQADIVLARHQGGANGHTFTSAKQCGRKPSSRIRRSISPMLG